MINKQYMMTTAENNRQMINDEQHMMNNS